MEKQQKEASGEAANSAVYYKLNNLCARIDVDRLGQSQETMHGHHI